MCGCVRWARASAFGLSRSHVHTSHVHTSHVQTSHTALCLTGTTSSTSVVTVISVNSSDGCALPCLCVLKFSTASGMLLLAVARLRLPSPGAVMA